MGGVTTVFNNPETSHFGYVNCSPKFMKSLFPRVGNFIKKVLRSGPTETEIDEELSFHLDRLADENIRKGMDPEAAKKVAGRAIFLPYKEISCYL